MKLSPATRCSRSTAPICFRRNRRCWRPPAFSNCKSACSRAHSTCSRRAAAPKRTSISRHPISRPPKATSRPPRMRCASLARPTLRSSRSWPTAGSIPRCWFRVRFRGGSWLAVRLPGCWSSRATRRLPIRSPISRRCGCWPMSSRPMRRPTSSGSRSRSRCPLIRTRSSPAV